MSEGLNIDPHGLHAELLSNDSCVGGLIDQTSNAVTALEIIANDTTQTGVAYSAMKTRLKNYEVPVMQGYASLLNCVVGYYRLQQRDLDPLMAFGDGSTDEKVIDQQISDAQKRISDNTDIVNANPPGSTVPNADSTRQAAQKLVSDDQSLVSALQSQEKLIETYNAQTAALYGDTKELCTLINRGISVINSMNYNGSKWVPLKEDNSWQKELAATCKDALTQLQAAQQAATQGRQMMLGPDGKTIYYNGQDWPVWDPSTDPDDNYGYDPTDDSSWTTVGTETGSYNDFNGLEWWLSVTNPSLGYGDADSKTPSSDELKAGTAERVEEATIDSEHKGKVTFYFQQKGSARRVVIKGTDEHADTPAGVPYEAYISFDAKGNIKSCLIIANGIKYHPSTPEEIIKIIESKGL
jgi:hypothetical protein